MSDLVERFPTIQRLAAWTRGAISYQGPELVAEAVQCWHALEAAEREREAMRELLARCRPAVRSHYMRTQQAVLNNKVPYYSDVLEQDEKNACELLDTIDALPRDEPPAKEGL